MKNIFAVIVLLILISCEPEINHVAVIKQHHLALNDIYKKDKVQDVLFDAEENNIDSLRKQSRMLFLSGIDAFRNKNNPNDAVRIVI